MKHQKIIGLKLHNDKFDANIELNVESKKEINYWINNIFESFSPLNIPDPDITVYTDASLTAWGIKMAKNSQENEITETNLLELKAIQSGVLTYCKDKNVKHIRIISDNTTAISYMNKKGDLKSHKCNKVAKEIWIWCTSRDLHKSAAHILGKNDFEADKNSRKF